MSEKALPNGIIDGATFVFSQPLSFLFSFAAVGSVLGWAFARYVGFKLIALLAGFGVMVVLFPFLMDMATPLLFSLVGGDGALAMSASFLAGVWYAALSVMLVGLVPVFYLRKRFGQRNDQAGTE